MTGVVPRAWCGALLAGTLLSGCAAVEGLFQPTAPAPAGRTQAARPKPTPARPAARVVRPPPAAPGLAVPGEPIRAEPLAPPAEVPPPAPLPALAGASAGQVETWLGAPEARTGSGAGERWTYRAAGCTLELFLFPDVATGGLAVLDRRAAGASEAECLARLRDAAG